MEQEIAKELNRAEPEEEAKNRVTRAQEEVSAKHQPGKETERKRNPKHLGWVLRTGEVTNDSLFLNSLPHMLLPSFVLNEHYFTNGKEQAGFKSRVQIFL